MNDLRKTGRKANKKYLNKSVRVLIEGKNKKGELFGKTGTNKNVKICEIQNTELKGKFVNVSIKKVQDFGLKGKIL